jgi:hypothetical protein
MFVSSSIVTSAIFAKKKKYPDLEMYFVENGKSFHKVYNKTILKL